MATTLQTEYAKKIAPAIQKELGVKNVMAVPRILKVNVMVGFGKIARKASSSMDEAKIKAITDNLAAITGQKATINLAKKAISNFKTRAGMPIAATVTLRKARAYDFVSKLVNITLPRVRDFRGISPKAFDGRGNYSLGLRDITVFPEIAPEKAEFVHGVAVTITTSAKTDKEARALLNAFNFPFQKPGSKN